MGCFFGKFRKKSCQVPGPSTIIPPPSSSSTSLLGTLRPLNRGSKAKGSFRAVSGSAASGFKRLSETLTTRKFSWERRSNLNHKDYKFEDLTDQTLMKPPNSINGNPILIHKCKDCKIFLFDRCDSIHIDKCSNCIIYVGPTKNTIYIRNCENCKIMGSCQQFRVRDSKYLDIWLFSLTRPAIEGCLNLKFACFCYSYRSLEDQFQSANLNPFNNSWSEIVDFDIHDRKFVGTSCSSAGGTNNYTGSQVGYITWEIMNREQSEVGLRNFIPPPEDIKIYDPNLITPKSYDTTDASFSTSTLLPSHCDNLRSDDVGQHSYSFQISPANYIRKKMSLSAPVPTGLYKYPTISENDSLHNRQDSVLSSPGGSASGAITGSPTHLLPKVTPKLSLGSATSLKHIAKPFTGFISSIFESTTSGRGESFNTIPFIEDGSSSPSNNAQNSVLVSQSGTGDGENYHQKPPIQTIMRKTSDKNTHTLSPIKKLSLIASPIIKRLSGDKRQSSPCSNGFSFSEAKDVTAASNLDVEMGIENAASSTHNTQSPEFDVDAFLQTISIDKDKSVVLQTYGPVEIESRWLQREIDLNDKLSGATSEKGGSGELLKSPISNATKFIKSQFHSFGTSMDSSSSSETLKKSPSKKDARTESPLAHDKDAKNSHDIGNGVPTKISPSTRFKDLQHCLVVFFWDGQNDDTAKIFVKEIEKRYSECLLLQTRELSINRSDSQNIFGSSHYEQTVEAGPAIGLEFFGRNAISKCTNTLKCLVMGTPGLVFVSNNPRVASLQIQNFFAYKNTGLS